MIWWFLILAVSAGAVFWAGVALYIRVRRHMKAEKESFGEAETRRKTGLL
jgi:amino acid permease